MTVTSGSLYTDAGSFTYAQVQQLLKPINQSRVAKRRGGGGKELSYLEAWDVRAHLIRVFGFGNFDVRMLNIELSDIQKDGNMWDAVAIATIELTIRDPEGAQVCVYSDIGGGTARLSNKGEAIDMAVKTASSDGLKRCAMNLGSQFGLSLYDQGNMKDVVMATMVQPAPDDLAEDDMAQATEMAEKELGAVMT